MARKRRENIQKMRHRLKVGLFIALALVLFTAARVPLHASDSRGKKVHLHGTLIDMTCWNARQGDTAKFLREHSKACLQMPDCIHSGYAIVTPNGNVYRMDAVSNDATTKWIASTQLDADWQVDVKGRFSDGLLDVTKIHLQK